MYRVILDLNASDSKDLAAFAEEAYDNNIYWKIFKIIDSHHTAVELRGSQSNIDKFLVKTDRINLLIVLN